MEVQVNLIAVLLAAASSMAVGFVWYLPQVFGDTWMKLAKLDQKRMDKDMPKNMFLAISSGLVMAYVLAHVSYLSNDFFRNSFFNDTVTTAFWMWLGFQALRLWMHGAFEQVNTKVSLIHMGHDFVSIMLMGVIIGQIGL